MNGTHIAGGSFVQGVPGREITHGDHLWQAATGFMHPDEVVSDLRLTHAEKREILASWASDACAVPDAPALRQLDNGAVVRVADVLQALNALDDEVASNEKSATSRRTAFRRHWSEAGLHLHWPHRLRRPWRRNRSDDDDDDPPPCPATIATPPGGPLSGNGAVEPAMALAA